MKSQHTIDDAGRLSFPAKLREALGKSFHIIQSSEECLLVLSEAGWQEIIDRINSENTPDVAKKLKRTIDATSQEVEPDSQGRIVINQDLRRHAGLIDERQAMITGLMEKDKAEIWSVSHWEKKTQEIKEDAEVQGKLASFGI